MTTNLIDIQNSDVIMCTNNMAENHPVGFQWVMKAKERGAKVIHVDPRFTRTSAVSDVHVPLRSGTNIAFFGGLMSYAMQNNLYFKDYVVYYTNASFLIDPAFKTPTDLSGLFEGLEQTGKGGTDPHVAQTYNKSSWKYQLDGEGNPKRDLTLKDPNSVFQLLRRHYSRYTPEMVERVCGIPKAKFVEVAKLYCGASGREKTGTITYALNLTQHTNGVQNIRSLCMLQLLLGNIGRPGGGVAALRGHANVQGATDLELLYHELPGYMAMPLRDPHPDLKTYLEKETPKGGFWVNKPKFFVSLLKAFYGDAATKDNEFGYQWLPKRASADAYSHQHIFVDMYNGVIKGFLADGQNPAVGGPNAKLARAAMQKLDWLVVEDIFLTETADVWKAPGTNPEGREDRGLLPPRCPRRREGRVADQHHAAHPVAREGGDAARRRDVRRGVLLQPGPAAAEALRRLHEGPRQGLPGRQLQVRRQPQGAGHAARPARDQRLSPPRRSRTRTARSSTRRASRSTPSPT